MPHRDSSHTFLIPAGPVATLSSLIHQGMLCPKELCPFQPSWHGLCALKTEFGTPGSLWLLLFLLRFTISSSITTSQPSWTDQFLWLSSSPGVLPCKRRSSAFNDPFPLGACRVSLHQEGQKTTKATDKAIPKRSFHPHKNVHIGSPGCFKLCVKSGVVTSCRFFFFLLGCFMCFYSCFLAGVQHFSWWFY